jgi:hypothetical protein
MRGALNVGPRLFGHQTGEKLNRPTAAPPPEEAPRQIRAEGRDNRDGQGHANAQAAASCQRTSTEQGYPHGDRHPALVGKNPDEERRGACANGWLVDACRSSREASVARQSRQIRGSRLAPNEQSAERESPESAVSSISESPRPAAQTVSRGVMKNRSRKDSSVSSLPSVRSTACWLIPYLPHTDLASGRPDLPIRRNWAMRERSWRTRTARRLTDSCGVKRSAVSPHTGCIERYAFGSGATPALQATA